MFRQAPALHNGAAIANRPADQRARGVVRGLSGVCAALCLPVLLAGLLAPPALALKSDRDQPVRIESDRAIRNEKTGTTVYIGNVDLRQGTLRIRADKLNILTRDNKITQVTATGDPAYMEQQPKVDEALVKARAKTIYYYVSENRLQLLQDASVEQRGSIVKSNVIDYNLDTELIKAHGGTQNGNQRVHMVIPASRVNHEDRREGGNSETGAATPDTGAATQADTAEPATAPATAPDAGTTPADSGVAPPPRPGNP